MLSISINYDKEEDDFKWYGSPQNLKSFVNHVLGVNEGDESEYGEFTEDKKHNALSYKVPDKDCSVRFYLSSSRLKVFGSNHLYLKDEFFKVLAMLAENTDQPEVSNIQIHNCLNANIVNEVKKLQVDLLELRKEMSLLKDSSNLVISEDTAKLRKDLEENRILIQSLKEEIKIHKENLSKSEAEKASLITAIQLITKGNFAPQIPPFWGPTIHLESWSI